MSDLDVIIHSIKTNGNAKKCNTIIVSHPDCVSLKLYMNFALEQNSKNPPTKASLTVLGFENSSGKKFNFKMEPFPCDEFAREAQTIDLDVSYKNMGYSMELPKITNLNLLESINNLNAYNGSREIGRLEIDSIAKMLIITSEAIRFSSVAKGVSSILENEVAFTPNLFEIIGWGGHSIAN